MPIYTVHIYREMRLRFDDISAETPEAAAEMARERVLFEADDFDDCEGQTFAALVDNLDGQEVESVVIDFEAGRLLDAAPSLLEALEAAEGVVAWAVDHGAESGPVLQMIRASIAKARAA